MSHLSHMICNSVHYAINYMVKKFRATCDISKQIDDHFLFITFLFSKFIYYYFKKYSQFPSFTLSSEPSHIPLINML